jgi:diaminopimelate epimerase
MHGLGNDFIVFDAPAAGAPAAEWLRAMGDRHTGIGFDQALMIAPARAPGTAACYRIFNADGDEVEQCGNGARCVAALVHRRLGRPAGEFVLDSPAGPVRARVRDDGLVSVAMGEPDFRPESLPFKAGGQAHDYDLRIGGEVVNVGAVSIGNPHAVMLVDSVEQAEVARLGPPLEHHACFPKRTNVEFLQVVDRKHVKLRVHERGVGETQACGTGACGAVAVGRRWNLLDPVVEVQLPGGRLIVEWQGPGETIWLTGPAETVFEGTVPL